MKLERFEDVQGWQKARELTQLIGGFIRYLQFSSPQSTVPGQRGKPDD